MNWVCLSEYNKSRPLLNLVLKMGNCISKSSQRAILNMALQNIQSLDAATKFYLWICIWFSGTSEAFFKKSMKKNLNWIYVASYAVAFLINHSFYVFWILAPFKIGLTKAVLTRCLYFSLRHPSCPQLDYCPLVAHKC